MAKLPLIRAVFFAPFVDELRRHGFDPSALLTSAGLSEESLISDDSVVPANVMYRLGEDASALADDPFLGATMGSRFDFTHSVLFNPRGRRLATLADVLICFVTGTADHASSQLYSLSVDGWKASLRGKRTFVPAGRVYQVDAWDVALWTTVMRRILGKKFDASKCTVRLSNPGVIPEKLLPRNCLVKGDNTGCEIRFPSAWLEARNPIGKRPAKRRGRRLPPPGGVERTLREALRSMKLSNAATVKQAARHFGMHPRALQRTLKEAGLTYSDLIDEQRKSAAMKALSASDVPVTELAASLGYTDLANFSRAFRRWTRQSPSGYRQNKRQKVRAAKGN